MNTDYRIEALEWLLNEDCVLTGYYPLIPYKSILVENLSRAGCISKSDCMRLSDEALLAAGLPDMSLVHLFKAFLTLYDIKPAKLKEIASLDIDNDARLSFRQLYHLPGVKQTRATLYYQAGFRSLADIAVVSPQQLIAKTESFIKQNGLTIKAPLTKEAKTHIAVAKAFTIASSAT